MVPILVELTEEKIKEAICKNFADLCDILPKEQVNACQEDGMRWFSSSVSNPLFNRVVSTNCNEVDLPLVVDDITNYYQEKKLPFMWMTCSELDKPHNLKNYLEENGFGSIGTMPGMALKLEDLSGENANIPGLEIEEVKTEDDFSSFMKVLKEGFEATDEVANGFRIIDEAILNQPEYGTHFLARLDGEVVAISSVIYLAGVAGIYNVATLEKARSKGMGTAITKQPLFEAK
ncbi:GNAT family N-acetyltransferase [Bacillus sp. OK048]|uniref:GNAT family N-acetyltransferase n=1 Tax=Bacillus sp. OK048 TaxID=1882761 RepID=UPI00087FD77D|nr:GNAT family N-acetyltransferase [Bacillus sp. OK048]SDL94862.1 hypothetical protein SAMN05443253_101255 [Bacillus sp. OK048]